MASSKNTRPIHSIHFTWHLQVLKQSLGDAANKLSTPVVWENGEMECEGCGRSHSKVS
jgi:hypothetical protein